MLRTLTIVLMTNPSRGSAFYFRRRDDEDYDRVFIRYRDILTWTNYETSDRLELVNRFANVAASQ
jgi:hypothetical protein